MEKYFLHQIRGHEETVDNKGIVVANTYDDAKQGYHAFLGAYAYGHDQNTDFVSCMISDSNGGILMNETWIKPNPVQNA